MQKTHGLNELPFLDFHPDQFGQLSMADYSWYKYGYGEGYEEGKTKRTDELKKKAKNAGYKYGLSNEDIWTPNNYMSNTSVKEAYELGFREGRVKAVEKLKKASEDDGFKAGYNLIPLTIPDDLPKVYEASFRNGYENGYKAKIKDAFQEGYMIHYNSLEYDPNTYLKYPDIQQSYKEGYEMPDKYQKIAFEIGSKNEALIVPNEIRENDYLLEMFYTHYQKGKDAWHQKKELYNTIFYITVLTLIIVGYFLYQRFKSKKL
ncbi:hypothetical protein [Paenibacillus lemnae]|uniref:Uncharacterized protein n=1 Tax=Paenibacillus lemnae TaxID=1330551 RepID=A0A848MDA9_PAELE|nr:hypothetical protein [Paenibacillus lemnae]NMO98229.1 hypothetical protein [Paenibacillus lemnae]